MFYYLDKAHNNVGPLFDLLLSTDVKKNLIIKSDIKSYIY